MKNESETRILIDDLIRNKGWDLESDYSDVKTEYKLRSFKKIDYVFFIKNNPIAILEAKKENWNIEKAKLQAENYCDELNVKLFYISNGYKVLCWKKIRDHFERVEENGEHLNRILRKEEIKRILENNFDSTITDEQVGKWIEPTKLLNIFKKINDLLRQAGIQAGIERLMDLSTLLFIKLYSEKIPIELEKYSWKKILNYYKLNNCIVDYINNTVLKEYSIFFKNNNSEFQFKKLNIENENILNRIIQLLNINLKQLNYDVKGKAFEYFLSKYLGNSKKDLGEYYTPREIIIFIIELIKPKISETFFDPFCGTGGFLIELFKYFNNKEFAKNIFGNEITSISTLTKMNMILQGDGHSNINKYGNDSINQRTLKKCFQKFDVVITNIPFGQSSRKEKKIGNSNKEQDLVFEYLKTCIESVNKEYENNKAIIIVPFQLINGTNYKKHRKYLLDNSKIDIIVDLPAGTFLPYAAARACILILTNIKQKKITDVIKFYSPKKLPFDISNRKRQNKEINDFDKILYGELNKNIFVELNFNSVADQNLIFWPIYYFLKEGKIGNQSGIKLSSIVEEITVKNINEKYDVFTCSQRFGLIKSDDFFKNTKVYSENTSNYKIVKTNDLCYSPARYNVGSIAINLKKESVAISTAYKVLRIKQNINVDPLWLFCYLKSNAFIKKIINKIAHGTVRQEVKWKEYFENVKVKLPKLIYQKEISKKYKLLLENKKKILNEEKKFFNNFKLTTL